MKVLINADFGGFGISLEALKELILRNAKCIETSTPKKYYGGENKGSISAKTWEEYWLRDLADYSDLGDGCMGHRWEYNIYKDGLLYSLIDRSDVSVRTDKDLIEVVEMLGKKANSNFSKLKVVEIPDDVKFEIDEYDGLESIHEIHRSWN